MKNFALLLIALVTVMIMGCGNGQSQNSSSNLSAQAFAAKTKEFPSSMLIDVRTPEEFSKGHLNNALNIDWNNSAFEAEISKLDKAKPIFVYCLSGGRSSSAASLMRSIGFKTVYELEGGIMKWRAANLPETTDIKVLGMSKSEFDLLLNSNKLVLVDFYADWCAPCKKMKPYLDDISNTMSDKVTVIRINADDNQSLCKQLDVNTLPVLQLYKNKTLIWKQTGYLSKEDILGKL
jgi:thioredoxin 1